MRLALPRLPRIARRERTPRDGNRFTFRDLTREAVLDVASRPARLLASVLGTALGVAALVLTVGFGQTTAAQVQRQFDAIASTQVVVTPRLENTPGGESVAIVFPADATQRIERLAGVTAAAITAEVTLPKGALIEGNAAAKVGEPPKVFAVSPDVLRIDGGRIQSGRMFDDGHVERAERVAVLGANAAARLGITSVSSQPAVFLDGSAYTVVGIVGKVAARADLLDAVMIPDSTARVDFAVSDAAEVRVKVVPGAGAQVGSQVALALSPNAPEKVEVKASAGKLQLGDDINSDISIVFLLLGLVVLLAGGVGIASVTTLGVLERTGEIGLRRALGATPINIGGQFIAESILTGLVGGLLGTSIGVISLVGISLSMQWSAVIEPLVVGGGVLLGAVVGWAAGSFPAWRASRIEPIAALRSS